jgi:antitoxin ParD1/3/4
MSRHYALTPAEQAFAEDLVGSGRYASVDDVVSEALRLLKEHEPPRALDLETLRRLWQEGIDSGGYKPAEEVFARLLAKYRGMAEERGA